MDFFSSKRNEIKVCFASSKRITKQTKSRLFPPPTIFFSRIYFYFLCLNLFPVGCIICLGTPEKGELRT